MIIADLLLSSPRLVGGVVERAHFGGRALREIELLLEDLRVTAAYTNNVNRLNALGMQNLNIPIHKHVYNRKSKLNCIF